jgi:predicted nucleic-acid-binding protein
MYKGILDTSVILRFLTGNDRGKKEKFKSLISKAGTEQSRLFVPLMVIIELVYVLEKIYKISKNEVREKIEGLSALSVIEVESKGVVLEALRLYVDENLKFGDAMILAKARVSGIKPVYTFDSKDFKRFPDTHLL